MNIRVIMFDRLERGLVRASRTGAASKRILFSKSIVSLFAREAIHV